MIAKLTAIWDRFKLRFARLIATIVDAVIDPSEEIASDMPVVVICPCGQKNRVRSADFNRRPICGKCKRMLRLPS